jgi:hypothetical protein
MATSDPIGRYYDEGDVESTGPAALAPSAPFGQDDEVVERFGDDDAIVAPAPSPRNNKPVLAFGADDDIVENPANPPRRNGTPERLVPLAPTAQGPAPAFGRDEKIVESPTNPPRVNGTPEHLVPLAPPGPTNLSFSRAASVALDAMLNGTRALTGSAGATGALPPPPPTLRELKRPELRAPLATPPEGWPENPVAAPAGTPAIPAPPAPASPGFGATVGEALWRGGKEGLQDTANAFKAWHEKKTEVDDSYVGNLLQTDIAKGYKSADWWGAQIGYGLAKSSPTLAAALGLGAAGSVVGPVGTVVGGITGFAVGSAIQEIAPAYQRARADGLSHEDAVNRAWLQSGIAAAFGAAMGAVGGPAGKAVEATIKQKIGQALADIFVKAPLIGVSHQAVNAKVEDKDLSLVDLGQGYVLNTVTGGIMVGGHKLISAAGGKLRLGGADDTGAPATGRSSPEDITEFVRRADATRPGRKLDKLGFGVRINP